MGKMSNFPGRPRVNHSRFHFFTRPVVARTESESLCLENQDTKRDPKPAPTLSTPPILMHADQADAADLMERILFLAKAALPMLQTASISALLRKATTTIWNGASHKLSFYDSKPNPDFPFLGSGHCSPALGQARKSGQ
ncbi:hypothetical protein OSB04_un001579 [Centaurea solstitialis]|uniref:Uncharacterized protein n=1 Tax=Centaurea solstitialis TaxID=347529 RepID=A0AA38W1K9_9ASTR|nr:hypothetical protein OSB04_un001579 [Centaurea solstitialis]